MIFADLIFIYAFLPICLLVYFSVKTISLKNTVMIAFSLIFYAWGEPLWILLLLTDALVAYYGALFVSYYHKKQKAKATKTLIITISIMLGIMFIFKYTAFFLGNVNSLIHTKIPIPKIALPLGISFYTFQCISYVIDVYWQKVKPQKYFKNFLLYVSMFPSLVAGPIVRYENIKKEITDRKTTLEDFSEGLTRIVIGLAKKVIIADNLFTLTTDIFAGNMSDVSIFGTWAGAAIYALYVYFDFSGYSDMAIGLGRIFGFHINENFNYPFISKNIQEFWQRWHISLGTFFKDYLLPVKLFGEYRVYGSLLLVWFCTGLWHGASWNFVLWGLYFGAFIMLEIFAKDIKKKLKKRAKKLQKPYKPIEFPVWANHIYTKLVLIVGFGIFYFQNMSDLGNFFKNLVGANNNAFSDIILNTILLNNIFLLIFAVAFSMPIWNFLKQKALATKHANIFRISEIVLNVFLLLLSSVMLVGATNNAFLYDRF